MKTYIFTYSLSLLLATALTPFVILWAKRRRFVDKPDARKIHTEAIPRVGGIAIYLGVILTILPVLVLQNRIGIEFRQVLFEVTVLLLGASALFIVGLCDDLKKIRIRTKLGAQCAAALLVCLCGIRIQHIVVKDLFTFDLGLFGCMLTVIWIVGVTNAVNLIDGLDGLAAGISGIASIVVAVLAIWTGNTILAVVMLALCGALTGFLFFNFHPARIFMGDGGSMFLGFLIAVSSVITAAKSEALVGICLPILVLGIPIFDTLLSMLRRYLNRTGIMSPDKSHFHHLLLKRGLRQHHVAILAYAITVVVGALGLLTISTRSTASILVFLFGLALVLLVFKEIGAADFGNTLRGIQDRAVIANDQRMEQKGFEEAKLNFKNAQTFDEWWQSLQKTGDLLGCRSLLLSLATRNGSPRLLVWKLNQNEAGALTEAEVAHIRFPMRDRRKGAKSRIEVEISLQCMSIESAGRRAALIARLIEEHGLEKLENSNGDLRQAHDRKGESIEGKLAYS